MLNASRKLPFLLRNWLHPFSTVLSRFSIAVIETRVIIRQNGVGMSNPVAQSASNTQQNRPQKSNTQKFPIRQGHTLAAWQGRESGISAALDQNNATRKQQFPATHINIQTAKLTRLECNA